MKSDLEILKIILNNIHLLKTGLCWLSTNLWARGFLTWQEDDRFVEILYSEFENESKYSYLWPVSEIEPRKNFLEELIIKLEEKNEN